MTWLGAIGFTVLAAVAGLAAVWALRWRDDRRQDAFQALAARRGWSLTQTSRTLGRQSILRLSARSGPGWHAETRLSQTSGDGSRQRRITEWMCSAPRWDDGTLIVGPAVADSPTTPLAHVMTHLDGLQGRRFVQRLTGGRLGFEAAGLKAVPSPAAVTVLATADPQRRIDLEELARLFAAWPASRSGDEGHPVLILSPAGTRLRLRHDTRSADKMESFIDLALSTVRIIG